MRLFGKDTIFLCTSQQIPKFRLVQKLYTPFLCDKLDKNGISGYPNKNKEAPLIKRYLHVSDIQNLEGIRFTI